MAIRLFKYGSIGEETGLVQVNQDHWGHVAFSLILSPWEEMNLQAVNRVLRNVI